MLKQRDKGIRPVVGVKDERVRKAMLIWPLETSKGAGRDPGSQARWPGLSLIAFWACPSVCCLKHSPPVLSSLALLWGPQKFSKHLGDSQSLALSILPRVCPHPADKLIKTKVKGGCGLWTWPFSFLLVLGDR